MKEPLEVHPYDDHEDRDAGQTFKHRHNEVAQVRSEVPRCRSAFACAGLALF